MSAFRKEYENQQGNPNKNTSAKNDKSDKNKKNPAKTSPQSLQFHYRIHGRVQGVSFRNWLEDLSHALGIHGFCRNRSDGTVEVVAKAPTSIMLETLEKELHKGPSAARVDRVEKDPYPEEIPEGFRILPSK